MATRYGAKEKVEFCRRSVDQSTSLGIGLPFGAHNQILFLSFL
jgi:hypothetical protein